MELPFYKHLTIPVIQFFGQKKARKIFKKPPIFIGGAPRSGTSILLSVLGAHPEIYTFPEEKRMFTVWYDSPKRGKRTSGKQPRIDRFYRHVLMNSFPPEVIRWCEKTPGNVLFFKEILDFWQNDVQLIHIIRDGRDVILSRHPRKPDRYWTSPEKWIQYVRAGLQFKDHPNVCTVQYENLVTDYQKTLRELCAYLGHDYAQEFDHWIENTNVRTSIKSWEGDAQEIHTNSIGKWRRSENKERIDAAMENPEFAELLRELNYIP